MQIVPSSISEHLGPNPLWGVKQPHINFQPPLLLLLHLVHQLGIVSNQDVQSSRIVHSKLAKSVAFDEAWQLDRGSRRQLTRERRMLEDEVDTLMLAYGTPRTL